MITTAGVPGRYRTIRLCTAIAPDAQAAPTHSERQATRAVVEIDHSSALRAVDERSMSA